MSDTLELMMEADRRGLLSPEKKAILQEAKIRGLVPATAGKHGAVKSAEVKPTAFEDFLRGMKMGTAALAEGAADVGGILYNPAAATLNLGIKGANALGADIDYRFKPLGDKMSESLEAAGAPKPQSDGEKLMYAGMRGAGSVVPTMGVGLAAQGARGASSNAPLLLDQFLASLTAKPATQFAAAGGAGLGSELVKQGGGGDLAQAGGAVAGGLTAGGLATAATDLGPASWRAVQNILSTLGTQSGAEKRAGETMLRLSSNPNTLPALLEEVMTARRTVPATGAQPTTAQLAADPGLLAAQNALRATDTNAAGQFANRDAANNAAWQAALRNMAPGNFNADTVANAVRSQFAGFEGATNEMIRRATERAQAHIASLGPTVVPEQAGAIIRNAVNEAYTAARQATSAAYRAVDPARASSVPLTNVWQRIAPIIEDTYGMTTEGTPPDILRKLTRLRDTGSLPLMGVEALKREFSDIAGDVNRSATDRSVAARIAQQIDDYVGEVAGGSGASSLTPDQTAQLRLARLLRSQQGQTFERGAVGQVTKTKAYGEQAVPNSGVAGEFLFAGSGSPEAAQQFIAAVGNRPAAVQALQNYAATSLRQYATDADGVINPTRLARWITDHRGALNQFPELARRIGNAANAQAIVDSLSGRQARTIDEVRRSALGYFLGDINPEAAIEKIMNSQSSQSQFGLLLRAVRRDPDAMDGLRRSMMDIVTKKSLNAGTDITGNPLLSQAKYGAAFEKYGPLLRQVFPSNHVAAMQQIQNDLDMQQLSTAAKALGSNTMQNLSTSALINAVTKGLVPPESTVAQTMMRPYAWLMKLPEQKIKDILTDAMLDPSLALRLVRKAQPVEAQSLSAALKKRAVALSLGTGSGSLPAGETAIGGGAKRIGAR